MKSKYFIFVISGPSGSGKTTLIKRLFRFKKIKENLTKITTYTTRRPRKKESSDYTFVDISEFKRLKRRGFFIESQKIYKDYYGTPKKELLKAIKKSHVLLCIDYKGAKIIKKIFKDKAVLIFILPPNLKELEKRIRKRGEKEISLRLKRAKEEILNSKFYDFKIINKNLNVALKELKDIILRKIGS